MAGDNNEVAALVNAQEGAIGYVGFAFQRGAKPMPLVNECGITTVPDSFSAKTEEYALQRRMRISEDTVYRILRENIQVRSVRRADYGVPRVIPKDGLERYCEIIAAIKIRT